MRESYVEDLASYDGPAHALGAPVRAQRSVGYGVHAGQLLSLEIMRSAARVPTSST